MKKNYFLFIALLSFAVNAQIVNIPNAAFKTELLTHIPAIDTNSDGEIQLTEAQALTTLSLDDQGMAVVDATGIEAFTNLVTLQFNLSNVVSLNLTSLTNLQTLTVSDNYHLDSLNLSDLSNLQHLNCSSNLLTSLLLTGATNLIDINCGGNHLTSLLVGSMSQLQNLRCESNLLTALDVTGLNNLTHLNCNNNSYITQLNLGGLLNLVELQCKSNAITGLAVNNLTNLTSLICNDNPLGTLVINNLTNLTTLYCYNDGLATLDVSALTHLTALMCGQNTISSLDLTNLVNLTRLDCSENNLTTLDISTLVNLTGIYCPSNHLSTLDMSHNTHLQVYSLSGNLFTTLDFSHSPLPQDTAVFMLSENPNLTYVNIKCGGPANSEYYFTASNCPNLRYICANENNILQLQNAFGIVNNPNVQINSYCTFTPGGTYNTIAGNTTFDADNNGCGGADAHFRNVKIKINDGTLSGAAFTNSTGDYSFLTQSGSFTLTPVFENPYFTISPASAVLNFATVNNATQTQNFCITPLGIHNDVEIVMWPMGNAPGFDQLYHLVYKNKGNQIQSGNINFTFDDSILDFVSAEPMTDSQTTNNLNWNYSNLQPFESRQINFKLNLNAPTEVPPVNIGDILHYVATINPVAGDETPLDNVYTINHTVLGSYDPNDKTCLEGNTIVPERIGDYLHYIIRFQNSGTAAAQNVVVKDMIDNDKFDISSFQITGSSHTAETRITGNKVEFIFENINLPNESADEPASHGYVAFKIKTKNNLVIGSTISNKADIYFDYNFPITTNTASTVIALLATNTFEDKTVSIFPNPVKDKLTIKAKDKITSVQLYDIQGRLIETNVANDTNVIFDLAKNTSGVYFVKIYTNNGVKVEKIIKE